MKIYLSGQRASLRHIIETDITQSIWLFIYLLLWIHCLFGRVWGISQNEATDTWRPWRGIITLWNRSETCQVIHSHTMSHVDIWISERMLFVFGLPIVSPHLFSVCSMVGLQCDWQLKRMICIYVDKVYT